MNEQVGNINFTNSVQFAINSGLIDPLDKPDPVKSGFRDPFTSRYLIKDKDGNCLARIDMNKVYKFVGEQKLLSIQENKVEPSNHLSDRKSAIVWANSHGYPVPEKLDGCLSVFLVFAGLTMFVIPGVALLIWLAFRDNQYERDMNTLVTRWIDAGRPEPGIKENIEAIAASNPPALPSIDLASRLEELQNLKYKELITLEEYESLRRKELGL